MYRITELCRSMCLAPAALCLQPDSIGKREDSLSRNRNGEIDGRRLAHEFEDPLEGAA
jgi:hypothetical protein